jgi:hypothetical protein
VDPRIGLALAHAEQATLHHLEPVRLHIGQKKQQSIRGGRQRAVVVHAETAGGPGLPIEAPRRPMRVERRLEGWDERLKLVEGQAGQIQELQRAVLHVGALYMCHEWCLLCREAPHTINRDNLN